VLSIALVAVLGIVIAIVVIVAKAMMGVDAIAGRGITPFLEMIMPIIQMMSIFVDLVVIAVIHAIAICKKPQLIGSFFPLHLPPLLQTLQDRHPACSRTICNGHRKHDRTFLP
jgi:hypothetical protein